jgi:phosphohistidine phosphatase SixA
MKLFIVRHVKAGDRSRWSGPDHERPISKTGRRQAEALAKRLAGENVSALIASPSVRCVQTLEPLGARAGLKIEEDDRLAEGSSIEESMSIARDAPDRAVLCSHGDVIPDLIAALVRRGMELTNEPDWRKATLWTLEGTKQARKDSGGELLFQTATVEPPPSIDH